MDMTDFLVVKRFRVLACAHGDPQDGVQTHATQTGRGSHAVAFDHMLGDGDDFLLGKLGAEEGRASPLRETLAADGTAEAANIAGFAGPAVRPDRGQSALAKRLALGVGAGEFGPNTIVHDALRGGTSVPKGYHTAASEGRRIASPPGNHFAPRRSERTGLVSDGAERQEGPPDYHSHALLGHLRHFAT